jgi:formate-dependent nitrite reductase membrane component NrfD
MKSGASKAAREGVMVPEADFASYYGRPVLHEPVWHTPEIPGYFFLGGLAGASSLLALGAQVTGSRQLATRAKVVAAGAIGLGSVALVRDLGRPERFYNMLRVFKPTSPMSVGSWFLAVYAPAAGVAAATGVLRRFPRIGVLATVVAASVAPAISTYTAALLADTAVPAWHEARQELPLVFAGSSALAAGGMGLVLAPSDQVGPARRLAFIGAAVELVSLAKLQQRLGPVGEPYATAKGGTYLKAGRALAAAGLVLNVLGTRKRSLRTGAGAALLAASACTRFGVFEVGRQSAADPKYTVDPQRARVDGKSA